MRTEQVVRSLSEKVILKNNIFGREEDKKEVEYEEDDDN
jgi:hypothetical protein